MGHHFFALISRLKYISRWGLMRNAQAENVQEHSHMVGVLAHALAVIRRDVFGGNIDPGFVAAAALYHDVSEIYTGDLPTPVKYFNPTIEDAYHEVEDLSKERLLRLLPAELRGSYEPLVRGTYGDDVRELIKAADKLAAYIKCVEELKTGNSEFKKAAEQTKRAVMKASTPEVEYFMRHFLPSFELTLDEQE